MRNSADDVRMTYVPTDDMWMTYMPADDVRMRFVSPDNMRMMCRQRADDICHLPVKSHWESHSRVIRTSSACRLHVVCTRWPADDMRTMCTRADDVPDDIPDDICQISNELLLSCRLHVVCASSARRLHETSVPRLFQVKQQRTALLKMK